MKIKKKFTRQAKKIPPCYPNNYGAPARAKSIQMAPECRSVTAADEVCDDNNGVWH